jgi:hypothetical protein
MTLLSPANLDKAFALLVEAAAKGERCPKSSGPDRHPGLHRDHIVTLKRDGHINVSITGNNWRVVTILTGEHAGKSTAAAPRASRPVRPAHIPSAPRFLTREELSR